MKKSVILVLALCLVAVFAVGCSSDEEIVTAATQAPQATVEVTAEATAEVTPEATAAAEAADESTVTEEATEETTPDETGAAGN